MFLTDDQTLDDVAAALHTDTVSLPPWWSGTNNSAHAWAYSTLLTLLTSRGYLVAQILASDQAPTWERRLTKWGNLTEGGAAEAFDPKLLAQLDCRKEMMEECLTVAGVFVNPQGTAGQPATGAVDTSNDLFSLDPDDRRRGKPTRW